MPRTDENPLKRYYTIGEVAEMFDVSKSLVRFWENEFESLKPHKNSKGDRRFTLQNIDQITLIYDLVKKKGYTLDGAKRAIKTQKSQKKQKEKLIEELLKIKSYLEEVKSSLS